MPETLAGWLDLTVPDAVRAREFYASVLGLGTSGVPMRDAAGEYEDFCLHSGDPATSPPLAGVCHKRGANASAHVGWIPYFAVDGLDEAIARATSRGGERFDGPRGCGGDQRMVFLRDLDGAVFALVGV